MFNRTWDEYVEGFGDPSGNYWLGLRNLHLLTRSMKQCKLRVVLEAWFGQTEWAEYTKFSIAGEDAMYQLDVEGFSGNTTYDAMGYSSGRPFSTEERDNDDWPEENCATREGGGGGWWYGKCSYTYATGVYRKQGEVDSQYIHWFKAFGDSDHTLRSITMKIKLDT